MFICSSQANFIFCILFWRENLFKTLTSSLDESNGIEKLLSSNASISSREQENVPEISSNKLLGCTVTLIDWLLKIVPRITIQVGSLASLNILRLGSSFCGKALI